jgi:hypothetical protein
MTLKRLLLCSVVAWAAACGGSGSSASCTLTTNNQTVECIDYAGLTADQISTEQTACASAGAAWSTMSCTHTNSVGGCMDSSNGISFTTWYYSGGGMTMDQVKARCTMLEADGGAAGTFVAP